MSEYTPLDRLAIPDEVLAFVDVMIGLGTFNTAEDVSDFLEKPFNWRTEFDLWVQFGQPLDEDDTNYTEFGNEIDRLSMAS
jgi:hypothetical protein